MTNYSDGSIQPEFVEIGRRFNETLLTGSLGPAKYGSWTHTSGRHTRKYGKGVDVKNTNFKIEFANICLSDMFGIPVDDCSCDKLINFSGRYTSKGYLEGGYTWSIFSRGVFANVEDVFSVFTYEQVLNSSGNSEKTNFKLIEAGGLRKVWRQRSVYRTDLLETIANLVLNLVQIANTGTIDLSSWSTFTQSLTNAIPIHSTSGTSGTPVAFVNWDEFMLLRGNVPRTIYMTASHKQHAGGFGPNFWVRSGLKSDLDYTFLINQTKNRGTIDGMPQGEDDGCCTEGIAGWFYSPNYTGERPNLIIRNQIRNRINFHTNGNLWYDAPGAVFADIHNPNDIISINRIWSEIKGDGFCSDIINCDDYIVETDDGPAYLTPDVIFPSNNNLPIICIPDNGAPQSAFINNFIDAINLFGVVEWYHNGSLITQNQQSLNISDIGLYEVVFGSLGEECSKVFRFNVDSCLFNDTTVVIVEEPYEEVLDSTQNRPLSYESFDDSSIIKVYPNPTYNEIEVDLSNLNETNPNGFLRLFSVNGSVLLTQKVDRDILKINLKDIPSGVYVLKYESNNLSESIRIIKL